MPGESQEPQRLSFAFRLLRGVGRLALEDQRFFGWLNVEHLELEVPNLRLPLNLADGPELFQRRRTAVRVANLSLDQASLDRFIATRLPNLAEHGQRGPTFADQATQVGYQAAAAVPMRLRHHIIGSLTLLNTTPDGVDEASLQLGQSLADMATIGLLQQPAAHRGDLLAEQLQAVLHHRVVLEQAKGALAEHGHLDPHTAYTRLRDYARSQGQHLSELARQIATTSDLRSLDMILAQPGTPHLSPGT